MAIMSDNIEEASSPPQSPIAKALAAQGEERKQAFQDAATELQKEMELAGERIRALVISQPPAALLGYLWSQFYMGAVGHHVEHGKEDGPDNDLIKQFQLILEYVHAVWSSHEGAFVDGAMDEAKAQQLIEECDRLGNTAMMYAMASTQECVSIYGH
jgi:hypothetical protein